MNSKYIIDPNGRYDSVVGSVIRYGIGLPLLGVLLWVALSMCSCKTQCVPELIETHDTIVRVDSFISERVRDSIVYKEREDSIYERVKDSISVRQKGDTVWVEKYHESEKFKGSSKTTSETTNKASTETATSSDKQKASGKQVIVKTERYIPDFYLWVTWCSIAWIVVRLVWCVLGWVPQTSPWRNIVQKVIDKIVKFIRLR
jgi:hypothetical protein